MQRFESIPGVAKLSHDTALAMFFDNRERVFKKISLVSPFEKILMSDKVVGGCFLMVRLTG